VVKFCVTVQKYILIFLSKWNCVHLCTFHSCNSPIIQPISGTFFAMC
jgi:hypothetical protein